MLSRSLIQASKRSKIKVRFVELPDTIPVQGPETEVTDQVVLGDFMALLNDSDREVAVLLYSGTTNPTEVAQLMATATIARSESD